MWRLRNEKPKAAQAAHPALRVCGSCGMPANDPFWKVCPRCRAELSDCDGCRACGKCAK